MMNKMAKRALALAMMIALVVLPGAAMAETFTLTEATQAQFENALVNAQAGYVIDLNGKTIEVSEMIEIDDSLTIQNGTIKTANNSTRKIFEISGDVEVTFKNVKMLNTDASVNGARCIDTRDGKITLNLISCELSAGENGSSQQPLNIGGYGSETRTVNIVDTTISGKSGDYAVTVWVKTDLTIENSTLEGYAGLYFKDGSKDSVANVIDSTIKGTSVKNEKFGAIVCDVPVTCNVSNTAITDSNGTDGAENSEYAAVMQANNGAKADINFEDCKIEMPYVNAVGNGLEGKTTPVDVIDSQILGELSTYQDATVNIIVKPTPTPAPEATPVPDTSDMPQTGDKSNIALFAMLLTMSAAGMLLLMRRRSAER